MNGEKKGSKPAVKKAAPKGAPKAAAEVSTINSAAADINAVLKPEPLLNLKLDDEALSLELKALVPEIKEGDDLALTTWKVLKELGWSGKAAMAPKAARAPKAPKGPKVPGVVETIYLTIKDAGKKGVTKDEIAAVLKKAFPDRDVEKMKRTISAQVPTFMSKARGIKILSVDHRYFIGK